MCEHCEVVKHVLVELTGPQVASVIMKRVQKRLHGEMQAKDSQGDLTHVASLDSTSDKGFDHI